MENNQITTNTQICNFKSLEEANMWLANQNNIIVKKMSADTKGAGHKILNITLQYVISDKPMDKKFQITELKKTRVFIKSKEEKVRRQWQEKYPQYTYITSCHKIWAFRLVGGSIGYFKILNEKYIILYSFDSNF